MRRRLTDTSRYLSYVLRHAPGAIGLTLDREGWADIDDLITSAHKAGHPLDVRVIRAVVDGNEKQRFALSSDGRRIRAVQGHSTDTVGIQREPVLPPEWLFHGTATRFLEAIRAEGLRPGMRHHVHLSEDIATAAQVGQRHGTPVVLTIESRRMHQQGHEFYLADNGVWLTGPVPSVFILT
ncbi:RNA 2'-phosphotransferase [Lysobacter sp. TAF61]|uniref:RNA 2'-phosphotransferase n=1 Tax=Lysobacter sp. TAF61 TaxID=3233072 RepID=UPI003F9754BA